MHHGIHVGCSEIRTNTERSILVPLPGVELASEQFVYKKRKKWDVKLNFRFHLLNWDIFADNLKFNS